MSIFGGSTQDFPSDHSEYVGESRPGSEDEALLLEANSSDRQRWGDEEARPFSSGTVKRNSDYDIDYGESEGESSEEDRPNRYYGPPDKYRKFVAEERRLITSLDLLRANDLSIHLYNAHALKRHAQPNYSGISEEPRSTKLAKAKEKRWMPRAVWTAWPLRPEVVPRPGVRFGVPDSPDSSDDATLRARAEVTPKGELKECIEALCLRRAKEIWVVHGGSVNGIAGMELGAETKEAEREGLVMTADDAAAHRQLKPVVKSVMAQVDQLLSQMQTIKARRIDDKNNGEDANKKAQRKAKRRKAYRTRKQQPAAIPTRGKGRPRKYDELQEGESYYQMHKRLRQEKNEADTEAGAPAGRAEETSGHEIAEQVVDRQGRTGPKLKYLDRLPGESFYQMHKRLQGMVIEKDDSNSSSEDDKIHRKTRLRYQHDWHVVMRAAKSAGWDPLVIERASSRCEKLFEHSIAPRNLDE